MNKTDLIRKLTSRKFWIALVGLISGIAVYFGANSDDVEKISGIILQVVSLASYMIIEGATDIANITNEKG